MDHFRPYTFPSWSGMFCLIRIFFVEEQVHVSIFFLVLLPVQLWLVFVIIPNLIATYSHKPRAETYDLDFLCTDITNYCYDFFPHHSCLIQETNNSNHDTKTWLKCACAFTCWKFISFFVQHHVEKTIWNNYYIITIRNDKKYLIENILGDTELISREKANVTHVKCSRMSKTICWGAINEKRGLLRYYRWHQW